MSSPELADKAIALSEEVFFRGRECLLAHAVRAVEQLVSERQAREGFPIDIVVRPDVIAQQGRTAVLFLTHDNARITVDSGLSIEQQRMNVAHELGHILLAFEMLGNGMGLPNRANPEHEQWCKDFQKHLCMLLHHLYSTTNYTKQNEFPSLATLCKENVDFLREKMNGTAKRRRVKR